MCLLIMARVVALSRVLESGTRGFDHATKKLQRIYDFDTL